MIGLIVFHLLTAASILANSLTDRGVAEQRRNKTGYELRAIAMAEFEQTGGRVQGIEEHAEGVRRLTRKALVTPWVFSLLLTVGLTALGLPIWIPAILVASYVVVLGAFSWFVSEVFGLADGRGPRSKLEIACALLALTLKGAMVVAGICIAGVGISNVNTGAWLSGIVWNVVAIGILTYCYLPVAVIDRHLQKLREIDFARTTKTDAVLFLRSFGDDDLRLYSPFGSMGPRYRFIPGRKRFEEVLASVLTRRSEFVSVGRPGERLPMLGASRTYWDHDNWKDAIKSTASRTSALLVVAGKTPSLSWEMSQLSELGLLGKTLIMFPPDDQAGTLERYAYINDALKFETPLPDELKLMMTAIAFDQSGRPVHYVSGGRDWSSYVAALLHYQLVLDGDVQFDVEGMASEVLAATEDPFEQAAYILDEREKGKLVRGGAETDALVREILSVAEIDPADPAAQIGRAWQMIALDRDFLGARKLLTSSMVEHSPMIERALRAIDAVEDGGDNREILRARRPERFQNRSARIWSGNVQFSRNHALNFQRIMKRIGSAEDALDREAAYRNSLELLEFAKMQGISTVIAMAHNQLGEAEFERGNLESATILFNKAKRLRNAPKVQLSAVLPKIEPVEIIGEALNWLVRVADVSNDIDKRNDALEELLALHSDYGTSEDAASAAEQLGRSYGDSGDLEAARSYFEIAYSAYIEVGRLTQAGWIKFLLARAESKHDNNNEALKLLKEAAGVAITADDSTLRFETSRLAGDIQWKLATKTSDKTLSKEARANYHASIEAARAGIEAVSTRRGSNQARRRECFINLSISLINLGNCIQEDDPTSAQAYFEEATGIRRTLVAEDPEDYWTARRLGYSLIYLAENARKLQVDQGPKEWAQAVTQFSSLTKNLTESNTAAQDFSFAINQLIENKAANLPSRAELDALNEVLPAIQEGLRHVVEHASVTDAYKATIACVGLATEFDRASMRSSSHALFAATLDARRRLSNESPDRRIIRRGLAFSLINTNFGLVPENSDSALSDFRQAVSIFEELVASVDSGGSLSAKADLLTGLRYSAKLLDGISHPAANDFHARGIEVARQLVDLAPKEVRWKEDLAWSLLRCADAISKEDTGAVLSGYQAVLDLDVAQGFPAKVHWLALIRSARMFDDTDPNRAGSLYSRAVVFAREQLAERPDDEDFELRLARSLAEGAESLQSIHPVNALVMWHECIDLLKRRLPSWEGDLQEMGCLVVALTNAAGLIGSEDLETATGLYREADLHIRKLIGLDAGNPEWLRDAVAAGQELAELISRSTPLSPDAMTAWDRLRRDIEELGTLTDLTPEEAVLLQKATGFAAVTSDDEGR